MQRERDEENRPKQGSSVELPGTPLSLFQRFFCSTEDSDSDYLTTCEVWLREDVMGRGVGPQPGHDDSQVVRKWTQETAETLQDCFESADWDVLCEPHGGDIDNMTDCITDYIRFCEDNTMPAWTVHCFSNNC
ncbi:hypothetical protein N1851_002627 [Merluccius polli]|uniref:Uncharacterized protein n=1 Tax=Merluccius polli TaxID=89951 RepID=A0AA47P8I3_MERPO|nr:hypothetical protein N1851_002627 [Merluccius polli]